MWRRRFAQPSGSCGRIHEPTHGPPANHPCRRRVSVAVTHWGVCWKWGFIPYPCQKTTTETRCQYDFRPWRTRFSWSPFRRSYEGCCGDLLFAWSYWTWSPFGTGNGPWVDTFVDLLLRWTDRLDRRLSLQGSSHPAVTGRGAGSGRNASAGARSTRSWRLRFPPSARGLLTQISSRGHAVGISFFRDGGDLRKRSSRSVPLDGAIERYTQPVPTIHVAR